MSWYARPGMRYVGYAIGVAPWSAFALLFVWLFGTHETPETGEDSGVECYEVLVARTGKRAHRCGTPEDLDAILDSGASSIRIRVDDPENVVVPETTESPRPLAAVIGEPAPPEPQSSR